MNEKFFSLPREKRETIINAGYRVFSQNAYKNSPMREIAEEAGISKSLLFHYFHNKKELYLFLWENAAKITEEYLTAGGCYDEGGIFARMERGLRAKTEIIRRHPHISAFVVKAFYEKDPDISGPIRESYKRHFEGKGAPAPLHPERERLVPGVDVAMMYREMYWASEGYLWEMLQRGELDADRIERDFTKLLAFWKNIYLIKE